MKLALVALLSTCTIMSSTLAWSQNQWRDQGVGGYPAAQGSQNLPQSWTPQFDPRYQNPQIDPRYQGYRQPQPRLELKRQLTPRERYQIVTGQRPKTDFMEAVYPEPQYQAQPYALTANPGFQPEPYQQNQGFPSDPYARDQGLGFQPETYVQNRDPRVPTEPYPQFQDPSTQSEPFSLFGDTSEEPPARDFNQIIDDLTR